MRRSNYSTISKFKKVEGSLRESLNCLARTLKEIDVALAGPRTDDEKALLRSSRDQITALQVSGRTVLHRLWAEVET